MTKKSFELIVCPLLLDELEEVLRRDKFRRWISTDKVDILVSRLRGEATTVPDPVSIEPVTKDPDDDDLIALATGVRADTLVSGDSHLTELQDTEVSIITPAQMLVRLRTTDRGRPYVEREPQ